MPFLTISELTDSFAPPSHEQVLDLTDKPVTCEPFGDWTVYVRLYSDEDCFVAFGEGRVEQGNFPIPCCTPVVVQAAKGGTLQVMLAEPPVEEVPVEDPNAPAIDNTLPPEGEPLDLDQANRIDQALRST